MARVLLTISAVGVAIEVQERLERAGHVVTWDTNRLGGAGSGLVDVVIIPGSGELEERIGKWRSSPSVPAILVLGEATDAPLARSCGVELLVSTEDLLPRIERASAHRFGTAMDANVGRAALAIASDLGDEDMAEEIIKRGRNVAGQIVRDALEPRSGHYVESTPIVEALREKRVLDVPEIETANACTGAVTLKTIIATSRHTPLEVGRAVWAMSCVGAIRFHQAPTDDATPERRRTRALRSHILAREMLALSTAYDVLDLTRGAYLDDVEDATKALGYRFAPPALAPVDLGECEVIANKHWERILEARAALYYEEGQKQLDRFIDAQLQRAPGSLPESWGRPDMDPKAARAAFERGQAALSSGEVFAAVSEMATAARSHPRHPVYEAYLAWARYRSEVARGADRTASAAAERRRAEEASLGRRPFAQALVAIGLLCVADGDPASARWHLNEALALNPDLPAANIILRRL